MGTNSFFSSSVSSSTEVSKRYSMPVRGSRASTSASGRNRGRFTRSLIGSLRWILSPTTGESIAKMTSSGEPKTRGAGCFSGFFLWAASWSSSMGAHPVCLDGMIS